jgi:hypothetical protein
LGFAFIRNRLFSSFASAFPVGSIPIARSIFKQRQATRGDEIGVKALIRWESLRIYPDEAAVSSLTHPCMP